MCSHDRLWGAMMIGNTVHLAAQSAAACASLLWRPPAALLGAVTLFVLLDQVVQRPALTSSLNDHCMIWRRKRLPAACTEGCILPIIAASSHRQSLFHLLRRVHICILEWPRDQ